MPYLTQTTATTEAGTLVTLPVINLNGTSPESLTESYQLAIAALRHASEVIAKLTGPHGRDYAQCSPAGDLSRAVTEHRARLDAIGDIIDQFSLLALLSFAEQDRRNVARARG